MRTPYRISSVCRLLLLAVMILSMPGAAAAQVPQDTAFSGRMVDGLGNPLVGPVDFELLIYDADFGGNLIYRELHTTVSLGSLGEFSVLLGGGTPQGGSPAYDADLFDGIDRYVEVELVLPTQETLAPRVPLATAPWAFVAERALVADAVAPDPTASPVVQYLSIPSSAFTSRETSAQGWDGNATGTNREFDSSSFLFAPVNLPHEATVTQLRCGGRDDSSTAVLWFTLRRNQPQVANVDMASLETTQAAVGFQVRTTSAITSPVIDNEAFNYYIVAQSADPEVGFPCPNCTVGFCRIRYEVDTP